MLVNHATDGDFKKKQKQKNTEQCFHDFRHVSLHHVAKLDYKK